MLFAGLLCSLSVITSTFASTSAPLRNDSNLLDQTTWEKPDKFFQLTLTQGPVAPDGVKRTGILVNGQMPGPELIVDEDDLVHVLVVNQLPVETTVHFHGIEQLGSIWSDGVPGVTQKPIKPGKHFLHKFRVSDQHGNYWYHSHSTAETADGLKGPFTIRPKKSRKSPLSLITKSKTELKRMEAALAKTQPVMLSDWRHTPSADVTKNFQVAGTDPLCLDSLWINGRGRVICPDLPSVSKAVSPLILPLTEKACLFPNNSIVTDWPGRTVYPEKVLPAVWYGCKATKTPLAAIEVDYNDGYAVLGIINSADVWELIFSIDEHSFWVIGADGHYIKPTKVETVSVPCGERIQVLVKLDQNPKKDYPIRVIANVLPQAIGTYGVLRYSHHPKKHATISKLPFKPDLASDYKTVNARPTLDHLTIQPFEAPRVPQKADTTIHFSMLHPSARQFTVNGHSPLPISAEDIARPVLYDYNALKHLNASTVVKHGAVVDLIFDIFPPLSPPHPMHKHGRKGYVIGSGAFARNFTTVEEGLKTVPGSFNLVNPPLRDGFNTLPAIAEPSWMAVRYVADQDGPFLIHCHISQHLSAGMAFVIIQGHNPQAPPEYGINGNGL